LSDVIDLSSHFASGSIPQKGQHLLNRNELLRDKVRIPCLVCRVFRSNSHAPLNRAIDPDERRGTPFLVSLGFHRPGSLTGAYRD
jgi:hypothetical protein